MIILIKMQNAFSSITHNEIFGGHFHLKLQAMKPALTSWTCFLWQHILDKLLVQEKLLHNNVKGWVY